MLSPKYYLQQSNHPYYVLNDHGEGFDQNLKHNILDQLPSHEQIFVSTDFVPSQDLKSSYPHIKFSLKISSKIQVITDQIKNYRQHPALDYENFVCSFNGADHVSRKLLVSALHQRKWFDFDYSSKRFVFTVEELDGHIKDYVGEQDQFYRKFFINHDTHDFSQTTNSFNYIAGNVTTNILELENRIAKSFLHIVSESVANTYYPFVTEKFAFSAATRGLFLTYGQPKWHQHISEFFGFKLYTKLFDYRFDNIHNPVIRLIELLSMISKFSNLSKFDWHDLYQLEFDSIEYNYDHLQSGNWIKHLAQFKE